MRDEWDFFQRQVNGKPASIMMNLGLFGRVPQMYRPVLARVKLKMRFPRADGLSSNEEYESVNAVEDLLLPRISDQCEGLYVGRITSVGTRSFSIYVGKEGNVKQVVAETIVMADGYTAEVAFSKDPKWVHYLEELYPTPAERQSMLNRRVVDGLRKEGDDLSKPRPVDHFLYFPDARSRQAFLSQAREMGFQLLGKLPEAKPRDLPFGLSIVREDFVHPPHCIDDFVAKLMNLAEQYEGEYDGWGCEIVMLQ